MSPHRPADPSLGLAPDERIIRASDFLGGGDLNALTNPQPAVLHSHYATSGEAKEYVRLEIQPAVATSTAISTCLLSRDRHACGIATATAVGYLICGYSLRLLHEYVAAAWHGAPACPPSAHYPPTTDETLSRPTLSAIAEMTGSEAQAAAKAEPSAKALPPAATQVETGTKSVASAALPTGAKAAVVTLSPPDWAVPVDNGGRATREAAITTATAAPDPLHTGTTALAGTTFGTITPTSSTAHPPVPTGTETIPPLMLHYSHIHYDNFIGNEHWIAMNDVLTRAMTKAFYQHFFDPLLRDIAFEMDSGQGIPLPILLENVQRRLAEAKAALAQHSALINIGVMEGYARQINQIQQTLAETFPAASVVTGATAAEVIAASAHHSANRPYSLAELLQRRIAIQPLKQALKDRFSHRFGPAEAPLPSLPPRFHALWAAASGLVEHAIVNKDVQNYILLDERAGDYFARYTSSLYQQWLDELYHGDPGPTVLAQGKPIFNELFLSSSYFGYYGADQQQSLNETFTTLVAYYHLLPALARWQNNVRLDEPTIPFTVLNEIQTALLAIPATPEQQ